MTALLSKAASVSRPPHLIFVRLIRFEKRRARVFTVSVWRRVRGRTKRTASIWGDELKQAMEAGQ